MCFGSPKISAPQPPAQPSIDDQIRLQEAQAAQARQTAAEQFQKLQVSYEVLRAAEERREWKG